MKVSGGSLQISFTNPTQIGSMWMGTQAPHILCWRHRDIQHIQQWKCKYSTAKKESEREVKRDGGRERRVRDLIKTFLQGDTFVSSLYCPNVFVWAPGKHVFNTLAPEIPCSDGYILGLSIGYWI